MSNKMLVPIQANIVPRNSFDSGANEITYSEFVYKYIAPSPWIHKTKINNDAHKDKHDNEIYKEEHHIFYVWLNDVEGECFIVSTMQNVDLPLFLTYKETHCTKENAKAARLHLVSNGYTLGSMTDGDKKFVVAYSSIASGSHNDHL